MDYLDRDAVLEAVLNLPTKMDDQGYGWLGRRGVWQMLCDFPSSDVVPVGCGKWFSVTEQLPEVSRSYLVAIPGYEEGSLEVKEAEFFRNGDYAAWYDPVECYEKYDAKYWTPLPEPPKEVE